jgi:uncharacterized protein YxeA
MNNSKRVWFTIIPIALIVLAGFFISIFLSNRIDRAQRAQLLKEAQQGALLVPADSINTLSATSKDLESEIYRNIKDTLIAFRSYNTSARFVYVLGYRPEIRTQFFFVDSEDPSSADYSPPGQLFPDTREIDITNYLKAEPYNDGPYRDSWGEWVSAYAPIKDTEGNIVALLGIDTATSVWHEQIVFVRGVIALIAILLSVIVVFVASLVYRKQISIDSLEKQNRTLVHKQNKMKELQTMAQIGRITIYFPAETFSFDGQFSQTLSLSEGEFLDKKTLLQFVHIDDQEKFSRAINEIEKTDISYTWVDVRIGTKEKGFRLCHIYGNIERNEQLAPIRFSGIIQDITDIHNS